MVDEAKAAGQMHSIRADRKVVFIGFPAKPYAARIQKHTRRDQ